MPLPLRLVIATLALHCACHPPEPATPSEPSAPAEEPSTPSEPAPAAPPVARPGPSRTVPRARPTVLDGRLSSAPDGDLLTSAWWSFVSLPSGSRAVLSRPHTLQPSFTPDLPGEYVVQLVVSTGTVSSAPATLTLTALNTPPQGQTGTKLAGVVGTSLSLSGQGSDEDGDSLTFSWSLLQRPPGSTAALAGADTTLPSLVPDVEGDYLLTFVVDDGFEASPSITVRVTAHRPIHRLGHRVVDAEYSKALELLVMVDSNPSALYLYDPRTRAETKVALPGIPSAVSVAPDGRFAAVAQHSSISYVDLTTRTILKTLRVSTYNISDIVLAGNGYAYVFQENGGRESHSIHLATGTETLSSGMPLGDSTGTPVSSFDRYYYDGTRARLHPSGDAMYGIRQGDSPEDITRYGLTSGTAQILYDSPYHGEYPLCGGEPWFSEDGALLFTRCGKIFRVSNIQAEDLTYAGALMNVGFIRDLSHSAVAKRIALVPDRRDSDFPLHVDTQLHLFTHDSFAWDKTVSLPSFVSGGKAYTAHGRFVFFTAAGDKLLVILQGDTEEGMWDAYGIVTY